MLPVRFREVGTIATVGVRTVTAVVLTQGTRPAELERAVRSLLAQAEPGRIAVDVVVVGNGVATVGLPASLPHRFVPLPDNVGIPEGRNIGARHATGELLAFLDDDAELLGTDVLRRAIDHVDRMPDVGAVAWRLVDEHARTARRHVPRLGGESAGRSGRVTAFLGGAVVLRRESWQRAGGYLGDLFYAMEETDLGWRLADLGQCVWYDAEALVFHPASTPTRHPESVRRTARNRAWIAHRNLPLPVALAYLTTWWVLSTRRTRAPGLVAGAMWRGWRTAPGPRAPISWRAVLRLTRLGRLPVV
jgi:hypothetical protein